MAACGLDFGTSNTTLGLVTEGRPALLRLEGDHVTIPSAIFFPPGGTPLVGRAAMAEYVEGTPGRLMRSLKSVLGSSLLEETTPVGRERIRFRDVIARYLFAVKTRAEAQAGTAIDTVVHGRPVHFVDGDPEGDARAEDALREIAQSIGFRHVSFQYEPIAAALDYEQQVTGEEIALIADIGGGTSDFSIVRLSPERHTKVDRSGDILANDGVRIGGTDFDRRLSLGTVMPLFGLGSPMNRGDLDVPSGYFHDLATWSSINRLYNAKTLREIEEVRRDARRPDLIARLYTVVEAERGHSLAMEVEGAKIAASDAGQGGVAPRLGRAGSRRQPRPCRPRSADGRALSANRREDRALPESGGLAGRGHRRPVPDRRVHGPAACPCRIGGGRPECQSCGR